MKTSKVLRSALAIGAVAVAGGVAWRNRDSLASKNSPASEREAASYALINAPVETVVARLSKQAEWTRLLNAGAGGSGWTAIVTQEGAKGTIRIIASRDDDEVAGELRCEPAPGERGTKVRLALDEPTEGKLGEKLALMKDPAGPANLRLALRRAKMLIESGEIATARRTPQMDTAA
ncbi:hypothetical protein [Qipengyuania sp. YIM B01966]|uniref:hypothetical protein n=1 Tax=Qipengyuania sp. YIM B01966 TaxID=2778646 RepID=UPI0018F41517|nr:hypothetical protein [Qipengyuania sp. YIM B01966]